MSFKLLNSQSSKTNILAKYINIKSWRYQPILLRLFRRITFGRWHVVKFPVRDMQTELSTFYKKRAPPAATSFHLELAPDSHLSLVTRARLSLSLCTRPQACTVLLRIGISRSLLARRALRIGSPIHSINRSPLAQSINHRSQSIIARSLA